MGVRPLPADGLTVAGFTKPLTGLYALVTHSGVTLAPYLAWLVTGELVDGREAPELAAFRPTRFAGPGHP